MEEKRAWIMLVVSAAAYAIYTSVVLSRPGPLTEVAYQGPLLWTVGGAIVANILLTIAAGIAAPRDNRKDQRDREIHRLSEYIGHSFTVIGGVVALVLAMLSVDQFWIANVIYLGFVLSALLGSVAKIFAYRRGYQTW